MFLRPFNTVIYTLSKDVSRTPHIQSSSSTSKQSWCIHLPPILPVQWTQSCRGWPLSDDLHHEAPRHTVNQELGKFGPFIVCEIKDRAWLTPMLHSPTQSIFKCHGRHVKFIRDQLSFRPFVHFGQPASYFHCLTTSAKWTISTYFCSPFFFFRPLSCLVLLLQWWQWLVALEGTRCIP